MNKLYSIEYPTASNLTGDSVHVQFFSIDIRNMEGAGL